MNQSSLILASNSPRRQQLLKEAGINFLIRTKNIPENYPPDLPTEEIPLFLAGLKGEAFRNEILHETVIASDTIVLLDHQVLGKPKDLDDAVSMLQKLSGRCHEVITGVYIFNTKQAISFSDSTKVYFKPLNKDDIDFYVNTYKPLDKAGAYGIQEWIGLIGIERIDGSYFNVMGLPVHKVVEELKKFGIYPGK